MGQPEYEFTHELSTHRRRPGELLVDLVGIVIAAAVAGAAAGAAAAIVLLQLWGPR